MKIYWVGSYTSQKTKNIIFDTFLKQNGVKN